MAKRGRDPTMEVPPPPNPGGGPAPHYAAGGRAKKKQVEGEGGKGRRRLDRAGRRRANGGGDMPRVPIDDSRAQTSPRTYMGEGSSNDPSTTVGAWAGKTGIKSGANDRARGGKTEFRTPSGGVSAAGRSEAEGKGQTMPGGGFPIRNASDLANAKHDVGRAKNPAAARRWINRRAHELGEPALGESGEKD